MGFLSKIQTKRRCKATLRALRAATLPVAELWASAEEIFANSTAIFTGRVGANASLPIEAELLIELAENPEMPRFFRENLDHQNPKVVGYCLSGLQRANNLENLPSEVFERGEEIEVRAGSFFQTLLLGEYAKKLTSQSDA